MFLYYNSFYWMRLRKKNIWDVIICFKYIKYNIVFGSIVFEMFVVWYGCLF